jgi:hypothetical protein
MSYTIVFSSLKCTYQLCFSTYSFSLFILLDWIINSLLCAICFEYEVNEKLTYIKINNITQLILIWKGKMKSYTSKHRNLLHLHNELNKSNGLECLCLLLLKCPDFT